MKLFRKRTGIVGDYSWETDALITYDKLVMGTSSYRGGTTDYINYLFISLGRYKPRFSWSSTEHRNEL